MVRVQVQSIRTLLNLGSQPRFFGIEHRATWVVHRGSPAQRHLGREGGQFDSMTECAGTPYNRLAELTNS
jgi:hypothetical protein